MYYLTAHLHSTSKTTQIQWENRDTQR